MKKSISALVASFLFITIQAGENSMDMDRILESELTPSIEEPALQINTPSTMCLEKNQDTVEDITNYFLKLIPQDNAKLTSTAWNKRINNAKLVLQKNGDIEKDIQETIDDLMQSKTIHTQNPQEEALSFIYKIKVIADETQNKLHQTYDSKKIDTKNFKALFEILNDFLNRLAKEVLFLEKKQDFIEDITNHFSNLIPDNKENYNSEDWKQLVEKATPVLQKDGDIDQDTDDAIRSIEEKKRPHELISFKNTISRSARTAMNKLHRMYNSKKIDTAQFKTLYGMIIDFINRLSK